MSHANHTTLSNQIDKAVTLAEVIRSRTEEHSINRHLADTLIDILLTMTMQIDDPMQNASAPEHLSSRQGH